MDGRRRFSSSLDVAIHPLYIHHKTSRGTQYDHSTDPLQRVCASHRTRSVGSFSSLRRLHNCHPGFPLASSRSAFRTSSRIASCDAGSRVVNRSQTGSRFVRQNELVFSARPGASFALRSS